MEFAMWSTTEGQAAVVLSSTLLLILLSYLLLLFRNRSLPPRKLNLPPSPSPSLPFLGNILHLGKLHSSWKSLSDQLGPIFTLHVGNTPIIYITSAALAHEALVQKGLAFAGRPLLPSRALITNNFRNIHAAPYGPYWRATRRNLVHEMLAVPKMLSFNPVRFNALEEMISCIRTEAQHGEGSVSVFPIIRTALFDIVLFMCFGFRMSKEDAAQMSALLDELLLFTAGSLQDFFYCLKFLNGRNQQRARALRAKQMQVFTPHLEKHHELKKLGQLTPGSYIESLLCIDGTVSLSTLDIVVLCTEFIGTGTETTITTLEWAMARITADSRIQSKLYNQVYDVVGNEAVQENNVSELPYLQAFINETLRLHPPTHCLIPHTATEPCEVGGYDIPMDAIVVFNLICMSKDPEIWEEPLKFEPERFLAAEVDITGSKEMRMMPFGAGRRICPGLGLAFMHLELFVARLVQAFEWSVFPSGATVDLSERPILTVRMKHPLQARVKERKGVPVDGKSSMLR